MENFWQGAFLSFSAPEFAGLLRPRAHALLASRPELGERLRSGLGRLLTTSARQGARPLPEDFWLSQPPMLRIFAGHAQMALQNEDYSTAARQAVLTRTEQLREALA
ncbi:MAG: hypothetical protein K2G99_06045 [Desulfovibrio sp.]|nr:hypothetical protein [Desulfovibrio sp.]